MNIKVYLTLKKNSQYTTPKKIKKCKVGKHEHIIEKNQLTKTGPELIQMLELINKDMKTVLAIF